MDFPDSNEGMRTNEKVYYGPTKKHHSSLAHEAIAEAAGFEAMKAYENHLRNSGEKPSHPVMKEMLAGLAAGAVDKLIETKGLDEIDAMRAKQMATQEAHRMADEKYSGATAGPGYYM